MGTRVEYLDRQDHIPPTHSQYPLNKTSHKDSHRTIKYFYQGPFPLNLNLTHEYPQYQSTKAHLKRYHLLHWQYFLISPCPTATTCCITSCDKKNQNTGCSCDQRPPTDRRVVGDKNGKKKSAWHFAGWR